MQTLTKSLLAFPCVVLVATSALAQGHQEIVGTWIGIDEENKGEVVTVGADFVVVDGQRLPLRVPAPGILLMGPPGAEERIAYGVQGGQLVTLVDGVRMRWRRAGPAPAPPQPSPTPRVEPQPPKPQPPQPKATEPKATAPKPGGETKPTRAAPQGNLILTRHVLRDPGVRNMESHTLLAPKGWQVKGGAWWANARYFKVMPSRDILVTAPDGRQVHLRPSVSAKDIIPSGQYAIPRPAEGTSDQGHPVIYMPVSLEDWKRWIESRSVPLSYPGATKISVSSAEVVPELTALLNREIAPIRQMLQQRAASDAAAGMRNFIDAKFLAFECRYTHEGHDWQELLLFGVTYQGFETQLFGRQIYWSINPVLSYRAHVGELEASLPLLATIANSVQTTPEWTRMRAEHQAKLNKIALETARQASQAAATRSRILAGANSEVGDIIHEGYRKRSAMQDRSQHKLINSIHETQDYVVPGGQTSVQLPSHYSNVYTNGSGDYLLTNDRNFNPNTDSSFNDRSWQEMKAKR